MATRRKLAPRQQISRKLTPMQERFCHEYVIDLNATRAAVRAGYSKATADTQGPRLLDNVGVHLLVERLKAEALAKIQMTREDVLAEIAKLARSNVKRVFGEGGKILSPHEMDDDVAAAVESFEARMEFADDGAPPEEIRKIKMHSKLGALKILAQHHGIIGADVQVNLGAALADKLAAARKRARKGEE